MAQPTTDPTSQTSIFFRIYDTHTPRCVLRLQSERLRAGSARTRERVASPFGRWSPAVRPSFPRASLGEQRCQQLGQQLRHVLAENDVLKQQIRGLQSKVCLYKYLFVPFSLFVFLLHSVSARSSLVNAHIKKTTGCEDRECAESCVSVGKLTSRHVLSTTTKKTQYQ